MPTDLFSLLTLGQSLAGNMMQDIMQAIAGNNITGLMQIMVGMVDGVFGDMQPEEAVHTLLLSREMLNGLIEKYAALIPQPTPPAVEAPAMQAAPDTEVTYDETFGHQYTPG